MFETRRGDGVSQSTIVLDLVSHAQIGEVITYEVLVIALERPKGDVRGVQAAVQDVKARALRELHKGLLAVPRTGYRVVSAEEHEQQARRHHLKARRQLRRSGQWLRGADRSQLDAETTARLDRLERQVADQAAYVARLGGRVRRVEERQTGEADRLGRIEIALRRAGILGDD